MSEDQRIHARIHVSTEVDVQTPSGMVKAELRDVSKGGARFEVPRRGEGTGEVAHVGDHVEMFLPSLDGAEIAVAGQVMRVIPSGKGVSYGVRFEGVEPSMRQALLDLVDVLSSTSGVHRLAPPIARRIEIRFEHLQELRSILEDICSGGLTMTVSDPLALNEEVDLSVPDLAGAELLTVRARVVTQRAKHKAPPDGERQQWDLGLEFAQLRLETERCIVAILDTVIEELEAAAGVPGQSEGEAPTGEGSVTDGLDDDEVDGAT